MKFNDHSRLVGEHSFLSASKHSWINYDTDKLESAYSRAQAAARGSILHALAAQHIKLKMRMPKNNATFNRYVNDAIGFNLIPEQVLFYSPNAFGTADAIRFDERKRFLRIHDLKTGETKVSMDQLDIYEAFFCLEYDIKPHEIDAELRIYQNDEIIVREPEPDIIAHIMDTIIVFDKIIERMKAEDS